MAKNYPGTTIKIPNRFPKQLYCVHFNNAVKKTNVYTYKIINAELNLCKACERKLRKAIIQQDKDEKEVGEMTKNWSKKSIGEKLERHGRRIKL